MSPKHGGNGSAGIDLQRFVEAQEGLYDGVLAELRAGAKSGHWMWFIFPQLAGLGYSSTSRYYALNSREEARALLADSTLGNRLLECTGAVLALSGKSARAVFGSVDEMKFRSSMTLFAQLSGPQSLFQQALDKYFAGKPDERTLEILERL